MPECKRCKKTRHSIPFPPSPKATELNKLLASGASICALNEFLAAHAICAKHVRGDLLKRYKDGFERRNPGSKLAFQGAPLPDHMSPVLPDTEEGRLFSEQNCCRLAEIRVALKVVEQASIRSLNLRFEIED